MFDSKGMNNYSIHFDLNVDGIQKGHSVRIKKDTGEAEIWFPTHTPVGASIDELLDANANAQVFKGVCDKMKRKNL